MQQLFTSVKKALEEVSLNEFLKDSIDSLKRSAYANLRAIEGMIGSPLWEVQGYLGFGDYEDEYLSNAGQMLLFPLTFQLGQINCLLPLPGPLAPFGVLMLIKAHIPPSSATCVRKFCTNPFANSLEAFEDF